MLNVCTVPAYMSALCNICIPEENAYRLWLVSTPFGCRINIYLKQLGFFSRFILNLISFKS